MFNINKLMNVIKNTKTMTIEIENGNCKDFLVKGGFEYLDLNYILLSPPNKNDCFILVSINKKGDIKLLNSKEFEDLNNKFNIIDNLINRLQESEE